MIEKNNLLYIQWNLDFIILSRQGQKYDKTEVMIKLNLILMQYCKDIINTQWL